MQLVAGILRRDRLPKGPRDIAKLLADNDVAAAPGWSVPQGLEQVKRLSAAHLADRDAVQAQSQRRADEIRQRGDTVLCAQCHQVGSGAPKLPRILDEDDAESPAGNRVDLAIGNIEVFGAPPSGAGRLRSSTPARCAAANACAAAFPTFL